MTIVPMDRAEAANGAGGGTPVLEARGLTKYFPVRSEQARPSAAAGRGAGRAVVHAVEDVSLALPPAGITAVVGESGS
ncbi:MAG TPA: hypothetical protein VK280_12555, partial [Streptosporangiaceae bacterium]|nr:hypothetical protein [Streptosporangiaceae bacterium]